MNQRFILDIDGTLMPSQHIDNQCYWQAVHAVFQTAPEILDLHGFTHVSDSGIFAEWCDKTLGRKPGDEETQAVKGAFLARLRQAQEERPEHFMPLPGVVAFLDQQPRGHVALATGGWRHSARFKLEAAGLDRFDLPLASSDDAMARTDIMRHAEAALLPGETPHYIGDGAWDLAASQALGWPFIGIATGTVAEELRAGGADAVHEDFLPLTDR